MDQIRSTMVQQEALFKEQVEALHRLYCVQRSAMQEMKKGISAQPRVVEGKSYEEEPLSLSLHPFRASQGAQSRFVRDFDLEKIPEESMDDSELNNFNSDQACEVDANKFDTISRSITDKKQMLSNQGSKFTVSSNSSRSTISTAYKKSEEAPINDYVGGFWFTKTNSSLGGQSLQSGTLISGIDGQDENSGDGSNDRDGSRPSFSSTVSDPETKLNESESCSNSRTNMVKPFDSSADESSESVAAEILLSFVTRSLVNPRVGEGENEDMSIDKKVNIYKQRCGSIDESVKWTSRRRTLRRGR